MNGWCRHGSTRSSRPWSSAVDECLEVTPEAVRMRKVELSANERAKIRNRAKANGR